jgi:hypothetical protein
MIFRSAGGNGQEPVEELSLVGHIDIPEPTTIVDSGIYVQYWICMFTLVINHSTFL